MESTLTWLDLTVSDRDKMRRVLDLFNEQGTVDEMGLGSLRDALSEALFPGTSTLQTRLRYVLFIPWAYKRLEARRIGAADVAAQARRAEIGLIGPLGQCEDAEGTIGVRARGSLARLPSSVYWTALVRWGIFQHEQSQSWYHTHFKRLAYDRDGEMHADDPGVSSLHRPNWHPRLPDPPKLFPGEASFVLTREEADFLQGRLEERCAGSLLAWLAREGSDTPSNDFCWDDSAALGADTDIQNTMELARRFSLHVEGTPLLYNLLLAERRHEEHGRDDDLVDRYRAELAEWTAREAEEDAYDPNGLWEFVTSRGGRLPSLQRHFVERWAKRITEIVPDAVADDGRLRRLIEERERQLKGGRARLVNPGRLLDWNGRAGVGRMDFRWRRVRQLLIDLHRGLGV